MTTPYVNLQSRDETYRLILQDFTSRNYVVSLPKTIHYYQNDFPQRTDIIDRDRLMVLRTICESAYGSRKEGETPNQAIYETFFNYFDQYAALVEKTALANLHLGIADTLLRHAIEMLCEQQLDRPTLDRRVRTYVAVFDNISLNDSPLSLGLNALFQQAVIERTQAGRVDYPQSAEALSELFLNLTGKYKNRYQPQRVHLMNLLSDMASFEALGDDTGDQKALAWVERCLQEAPSDRFARYRARILRQRISVAMQTRRFYHDANTRFADLRSLLQRAGRLALPEQSDLKAALDDMTLQIDQLDGARRLVQNRDAEPQEVCIPDVLARLQTCYAKKRPPLYVNIETRGPAQAIWLDEGYLQLALERLLDNSADAYERKQTPHDQRRVEIQVLTDCGQIRLQDQAGGIDPRMRDIFQPYVSSKGVRQSTGLGLSNARHAMQKNRGTLELAPRQPAGGTAFILTFNHAA